MKIAIITGASSGLGREFVTQLDARLNVDEFWVIARRTARLEELKETIKTKIVPISLDLIAREDVEKYKEVGNYTICPECGSTQTKVNAQA